MAFFGMVNSGTSYSFLVTDPDVLRALHLRVGEVVAAVVDSPKKSLKSLRVVPGFFE